MLKPQVLERPVQLRVGYVGLLKIGGKFLVVKIVSDDLMNVSYSFPLRSDGVIYTVPKSVVSIPLADLSREYALSL